jgi:hypothetical protein
LNSTERAAWYNMIRRCYVETDLRYPDYGGRNIGVAEIYRDPETGFQAFYDEVGPKPKQGYWSLDRKNNDGDYEPGNIRWIIHADNMKNQRSTRAKHLLDWGLGFHNKSPILPTYQGKSLSLAEWARELKLEAVTLRDRFKRGWSLERALVPVLYAPAGGIRK